MRRSLVVCLLWLSLWATGATAQQEAVDDGYAKGLELFRAGRYEEAKPYFQRALDLAEARYGSDDPAIAVELNNLAEIHRLTGELDRAEALYRQAIALDERAGRQSSPEFATSLNNLALVQRAQGRLAEAEKLYTRSLNLLEQALGPHHPDVARSLNNLAMLYRAQGRPERAEPLQERALAIAEKALGPNHPTTQTIRRNRGGSTPGSSAGAMAAGKPAPVSPSPRPRAGVAMANIEPAAAPPEPMATARPAAPAEGGYALQIAAVRTPEEIEGEWKRQQRRYPPLQQLRLQETQKVTIPGKGTFYRMFAGPLATKAEAEALCGKLQATGGSCRAVQR